MFSHDTCKTVNVNHSHININKTANIKKNNLKVYSDVKADFKYKYHTNKTAKIKKEGDIALHHIDVGLMCCGVILPFYFAVLVV